MTRKLDMAGIIALLDRRETSPPFTLVVYTDRSTDGRTKRRTVKAAAEQSGQSGEDIATKTSRNSASSVASEHVLTEMAAVKALR